MVYGSLICLIERSFKLTFTETLIAKVREKMHVGYKQRFCLLDMMTLIMLGLLYVFCWVIFTRSKPYRNFMAKSS